MRLLLCGGGSGKKTVIANKIFNKIIDHTKPLLYVPLAMSSERYPSCLEWITDEMKDVKFSGIYMVNSAEELAKQDFNNFCAIFIGGGNTYKLLYELKESGTFNKLKEFIDNDGIIYGGSAGAIIMGHDINSCQYMDDNNINLKDTSGLDCLNGLSFTAHYTNKNEEKTEIATNYLINYTKTKESVYALPEEVTLYINGSNIEFIGDRLCYLFNNGEIETLHSNNNVLGSEE